MVQDNLVESSRKTCDTNTSEYVMKRKQYIVALKILLLAFGLGPSSFSHSASVSKVFINFFHASV